MNGHERRQKDCLMIRACGKDTYPAAPRHPLQRGTWVLTIVPVQNVLCNRSPLFESSGNNRCRCKQSTKKSPPLKGVPQSGGVCSFSSSLGRSFMEYLLWSRPKTPKGGNFKVNCGSVIKFFIISVKLDTSKNVYE